jgi:DNA-binding Lrp family transcriptional regulator
MVDGPRVAGFVPRKDDRRMERAIVLMKVRTGKVDELAKQFVKIKGISDVYSVGGRFNLVVVAGARNQEALEVLVAEKMAELVGIDYTETLPVFQTYRPHRGR